MLVNVYVYCVVNIVVHYDTALWCQFLIASCLCVFAVLIYILYSCVLSTFDCLLSVWLSHVHMYVMQMCAVNMWLFDVIVLLLCLYIYIYVCYTAVCTWYVYMYSIQLCSVNLWLCVVCVFLHVFIYSIQLCAFYMCIHFFVKFVNNNNEFYVLMFIIILYNISLL